MKIQKRSRTWVHVFPPGEQGKTAGEISGHHACSEVMSSHRLHGNFWKAQSLCAGAGQVIGVKGTGARRDATVLYHR